MKKKVIILGGGISGLAASVFLDAQGYAVELFERKPILGGRAYAFLHPQTQTWIDNGQHLLIGAYHHTIEFLENIGSRHQLIPGESSQIPLLTTENAWKPFSIPSLPAPLHTLVGLLQFKTFKWKDKLAMVRLAKRIRKPKASDLSDFNQPAGPWLIRMGFSKLAIENFWEIFILATLNESVDRASVAMLVSVLRRVFFGKPKDTELLFPKTNLNELFVRPARAYLEIRGHKVHISRAAKKIHVLDQKVQAIEMENGSLEKADLYVSALPFNRLLSLIPEGYIDSLPYFSKLSRLQNSPILSINLWFDREVFGPSFCGVAGKKIHWYFKKKVENGLHHYMGVVSAAGEFLDASREEIIQTVVEEMKILFPQMEGAKLIHSLVNKERDATFSPTPESDSIRPSQISPFSNLRVVGDWTQTGLPGTIESAVLSAKLAIDL